MRAPPTLIRMPSARTAPLALAADVVAVVVFVGVGRATHDQDGVLGLLGTVAPFVAGIAVAWAVPAVRGAPLGLRAGAVVLAGAAVLGLALRALFLGRLPLSFAVVAVVSLAVLLLGWRALAQAVARTVVRRTVR